MNKGETVMLAWWESIPGYNLVFSIELIRFKNMIFCVLALRQSNWANKQIVSF